MRYDLFGFTIYANKFNDVSHSSPIETVKNKLTKFDRLVLLGSLGLELGVGRLGLGELVLKTCDDCGGVFAVAFLVADISGLAFTITRGLFMLPVTNPFALAVAASRRLLGDVPAGFSTAAVMSISTVIVISVTPVGPLTTLVAASFMFLLFLRFGRREDRVLLLRRRRGRQVRRIVIVLVLGEIRRPGRLRLAPVGVRPRRRPTALLPRPFAAVRRRCWHDGTLWIENGTKLNFPAFLRQSDASFTVVLCVE